MTESMISTPCATPRGKGKKDGSLTQRQAGQPRRPVWPQPAAAPTGYQPGGYIVLGVCHARLGIKARISAKTARPGCRLDDRVAGVQINRFASGLSSNLGAMKGALRNSKSGVVRGWSPHGPRRAHGLGCGAWAMDPRPTCARVWYSGQDRRDLIATLGGLQPPKMFDGLPCRSQQKAAHARSRGSLIGPSSGD